MRKQNRGKQLGLLFGINRLTNKFLKEVVQKLRPIVERELVERICARLGVNVEPVAKRPAKQKKKRVSPKTKPTTAKTGRKPSPQSRPQFAPRRILPPRPKLIAPVQLADDPPVVLPKPTKQDADLPPSAPEQKPKADKPQATNSAPATKTDDINRRHLDKIF